MRSALVACALMACSSKSATTTDASSPPRDTEIDAASDADLSGPTDEPIIACSDSSSAVYTASVRSNASPGTVLACAPDVVLDQAAVQDGIGSGMTATTAVAQFVIAYQTRDGAGQAAVSTARVYLPHVPRSRPVPVAVTAHGSVGLSDMCAPSTATDHALPLPFAGRGFASIAPDLSGLGNAGTQAYLDNRAQGYQLLDAGRALRSMLPTDLESSRFVLAGYSQGGGAVLSAQALVGSDGPDAGQLAATIAYAPEWPISLASFGYVGMLNDPTQLTIATGLSYSSVAVLRAYAFFENRYGAGHGKDAVPAKFRDTIDGAVDGNCLVAFGAYVQLQMLHTGDLIDDTLRTGLLACIAGDTAGCTGTASDYYQYLIAQPLMPSPSSTSGPTLLVQGLLDQIMPAAQNAACVRDKLASSGVTVRACAFGGSDHSNIMDQHATGEAWAEATLDGVAPGACPEPTALPACQ